MLGKKIKELRQSQGLYQREIAAKLAVDTAFVSKVEKDEKRLSKHHLQPLSSILQIEKQTLVQWWLADKVISVLEETDESTASNVLNLVQEKINNK